MRFSAPTLLGLSLLSVFSVVGCSNESSELKGEFLSGCLQGGTSKAICTCTYDKLESHYSDEELQMMTVNPRQEAVEDMTRFVISAARECRVEG